MKLKMRVLFISSGNSGEVGVVVKQQGLSLIKQGVELDFYPIRGKGIAGYLKNIPDIKKTFTKGSYDLVHAHYSLSAFAATLAGCKPLVVSLMGSDGQREGWQRRLIKKYASKRWKETIVKSPDLASKSGLTHFEVIPNGVAIDDFYPISCVEAKQKLGLDQNHRYIFFAASPTRHEKNFSLARAAFEMIRNKDLELLSMDNIPHKEVVLWMNASDVVLLTSLWEGSPNVVKEAMACNRPVVATDVGDVKWLFGEEPGHYLADYDNVDVAGNIIRALEFSEKQGQTNGRKRILEIGLDSGVIAKKLIAIYQSIINENIS